MPKRKKHLCLIVECSMCFSFFHIHVFHWEWGIFVNIICRIFLSLKACSGAAHAHRCVNIMNVQTSFDKTANSKINGVYILYYYFSNLYFNRSTYIFIKNLIASESVDNQKNRQCSQ